MEKTTTGWQDLNKQSSVRGLLTNGGCGLVPHTMFASALNIRSNPTISATVLKHLCCIADEYVKQNLKSPEKVCTARNWIDESTAEIFKFFESELGKSAGEPSEFKKASGNPRCIWTGREFVSPQRIAIKWSINGPFLFKLPDILQSKEKSYQSTQHKGKIYSGSALSNT